VRHCHPSPGSVLALVLAATGLAAQPAPQTRPRPSLQSQIDSLKQGQERIQKDLEELKALLKEPPARVDAPTAARPPEPLTLNVFGEPFRGFASARVAILEFSDFDCSYCATYTRDIYPLLDHAYIQAGKVKYFFRDLPGPEHPNALFKARVARCAGEQEKFWEAHDQLFKDQRPFDGPGLTAFSNALGLDQASFNTCIRSDRYLEAIRRSAGGASRMRINGTPAFLIGTLSEDGSVLKATKIFLGTESFQTFRTVLDELLQQGKL
jgi:protein-disulfide isomerase